MSDPLPATKNPAPPGPEPDTLSQLLDTAIEAIRSLSRTQHRIQEAIERRQDCDERMDPDWDHPGPPIAVYREEALTEALVACAYTASVAVTNAHRAIAALHLVHFSVRSLQCIGVQSMNPVCRSREEDPQP